MIVIPAIDLKGGNCVRLTRGKPENETVYSEDPLKMAKLWQSKGAGRLHIIDLDGAFSGTMGNGDIIKKIVAEVDIPVQVGGGIREFSVIKDLIDKGVHRIIMGSAAIYDRKLVEKAAKKWPDRITVGIDSNSGKVAVKGWKDITQISAIELAGQMEQIGITELIVTDIKKDGTLEGPNIEWIKKIAGSVSIPVIGAGGMSRIEDIRDLNRAEIDNLKGIIIGKALYSGSIELSRAIEVVKKG
ncbi:MAG: 1-(5-phosphoribosyl)-5-[(5-phosphoribosylamino)methylideneamino]imidazole-4-carboxamide isomerase [Elusimicrobiota bacterium]